MRRAGDRPGQPVAALDLWFVRLLSGSFIVLGLLFLVWPHSGAAVFGLPAPEGASLGYLPAIGLRDLAFGLYLLILSFTSGRRVLGLILAATLVIPLGDMIIVAAQRGPDGWGYLLLHGLSAAIMGGASAWLLRRRLEHRPRKRTPHDV